MYHIRNNISWFKKMWLFLLLTFTCMNILALHLSVLLNITCRFKTSIVCTLHFLCIWDKNTWAPGVLLTVFLFFFQVSWSQMTSLRSSADTIRSFLLLTVTSYQPSQPGLSMMTVIWVSLFASFVLMFPRSCNYFLWWFIFALLPVNQE